jgi:actin-related protein
MLLENLKEANVSMQMSEQAKEGMVKILKLFLKEQIRSDTTFARKERHKKLAQAIQLQFNCSDALLLAPQAMFYSQILQVLRNAHR